jgi:hypothetical protein
MYLSVAYFVHNEALFIQRTICCWYMYHSSAPVSASEFLA